MKKYLITFALFALACLAFIATANAISVLQPVQGGIGSSSTPSLGQILVGTGSGTYVPTTTISSTITSSFLDKGGAGINVKAYGAKGDGITNDSPAFQSAINAASSTSGNVIVPPGIYAVTNLSPKDNISFGCVSGATLLNNAPSSTATFRVFSSSTGLNNFTLAGCTFTGGNAWYSAGNVNHSNFIYNTFNGTSTTNTFLTFFDTFASNTYDNINYNTFSGTTGGWDMEGGGQFYYSSISYNVFQNDAAQGIGSNSDVSSNIIGNRCYGVGNCVGLEGTTVGNVIQGNTGYLSGGIKLALNGGTDTSRENIVTDNLLSYSGGIENGNSHSDTIANNTVYRSKTSGIFGSFDRTIISNNNLTETNYNNGAVTVSSTPQTDGGIVLLNRGTSTWTGNIITSNKLYTSRGIFTIPSSTATSTGFTGGILIDSNYANTQLGGNSEENTYATVVDNGTGTTNAPVSIATTSPISAVNNNGVVTLSCAGCALGATTINSGGILSGGGAISSNQTILLSTSTLYSEFSAGSFIVYNASTGVISFSSSTPLSIIVPDASVGDALTALTIGRSGASGSNSPREVGIVFQDANGLTLTGGITGVRRNSNADFLGGLCFYVNENAGGASTFANLTKAGCFDSTGNLGIATSTPDSRADIFGSVRFESSSTIATPSIGGSALSAGGCSSATTTIDSTVASSSAKFITTPRNDPGPGNWAYTFLSGPSLVTTRVCAAVAETPSSTIYNVGIIK